MNQQKSWSLVFKTCKENISDEEVLTRYSNEHRLFNTKLLSNEKYKCSSKCSADSNELAEINRNLKVLKIVSYNMFQSDEQLHEHLKNFAESDIIKHRQSMSLMDVSTFVIYFLDIKAMSKKLLKSNELNINGKYLLQLNN
ncbi:hypothetical protein RFI_03677 [Reticulomyxa filosa]|uniref:Uncharacterized protein n=1 Tax=Reticulomyxa filosa TaxID=46433 RepID=X6P4H7_RETFI|nr:hypothetical protein RFI_03677 [Reticulomyxa filosa]|eukprot:ETO33430.1 hypothetical protein RFI_03677 [Reticulomyxa filosa]